MYVKVHQKERRAKRKGSSCQFSLRREKERHIPSAHVKFLGSCPILCLIFLPERPMTGHSYFLLVEKDVEGEASRKSQGKSKLSEERGGREKSVRRES